MQELHDTYDIENNVIPAFEDEIRNTETPEQAARLIVDVSGRIGLKFLVPYMYRAFVQKWGAGPHSIYNVNPSGHYILFDMYSVGFLKPKLSKFLKDAEKINEHILKQVGQDEASCIACIPYREKRKRKVVFSLSKRFLGELAKHMNIAYEVGLGSQDVCLSLARMIATLGSRTTIVGSDRSLLQCLSKRTITLYDFRTKILWDESLLLESRGLKPESVPFYLCIMGKGSAPSVPGVGEKKATELARHFTSLWEVNFERELLDESLRAKLKEFCESGEYEKANEYHTLKASGNVTISAIRT